MQDTHQELTCHRLTSSDTNSDALTKILELSNSIFAVQSPAVDLGDVARPSTQAPEWHSRLQLPGSAVFYVTSDRRAGSSTHIIGFLYLHPRLHAEIGGTGAVPHIWLAGVDSSSRGVGVFALLLRHTIDHARTNLGAETMTACTYPRMFGRMYDLLKRTGWTEIAWVDEATSQAHADGKVLLRLDL